GQVAVWPARPAVRGAPVLLPRSGRRMASDAVSACRVWLVLTPLVYAVSAVVLVVYGLVGGKQPEQHPILQTFQDGSVPMGVVVLMIAEAVIAAPIREELFF